MKTLLHSTALALCLLLLAPAALAQGKGSGTSKDLNAAANRLVQDFQGRYGGQVGVSTQVLKSGKVPYAHRGTKPMIPASNLKLVTTAVALDVLGSDFRFETRLYGPSSVIKGEMKGDLVLKGGGDPTFFAPYVRSSTSPFKDMTRALRRNGVERVSGNLVIDDSDFDREFISKSYHDRYLLDSYAAPVGGLGVNRNVVTVSVGPKGLTVEPDSGSLKLINKVKKGSYNQIWAERPRGTDKIIVHGVAKPGKAVQTTLTVNDPVRFAGSTFFRLLEKSGVDFGGDWRTVAEGQAAPLAGKVLIARHRSPKLGELVNQTNVKSDNVLAQHIFRRLGASVVGFGNVKNSEAVVKEFFQRHEISDAGFTMTDGSGLSEKNRVAPYQIVHLLKTMWSHKDGQLFIDSMPAPGEGTLRSRLGGTLVRAKTGTLNNHSGLSGYVVTAYGETVGFSIMVNDVQQTWPAVELQDKLVSLIARWDRPL